MMPWIQREITLRPRARGFHVVTGELLNELPELQEFAVGLAHFFIRHTSASLSINENVSPEVRTDLESHLNVMVPERQTYYRHTLEGPDDMPAHIKASLLGNALVVPVGNGRLLLGTWQGIYLGEHRDDGGPRRVVVTLFGERRPEREAR